MKIYKYWVLEKGKLVFDCEEKEVSCYGGSNVSCEEAVLRAREKIAKVQRKVKGERRVFEKYEVEIREEIVRKMSDKAIVTRNRYGAQVLNAEELMILDIDKPRFSFWDLFKKREESKTKIVGMVRALAQKPAYMRLGFRIYETAKGIRVIVLGKTFDATSAETAGIMKEFHCDALYAFLCRKQDCFRARLTPKPSRMKLRAHKVAFPRDDAAEEAFRAWLAEYEAASRKYSVCRFIEQAGSGSSNDVVRLHDEATGAQRGLPLA